VEIVQDDSQGKARHRKYKRPKLGGGQAYYRSSDKAAVVAKDTKIGMMCSVMPVLTEDLCVVQKEDIFNNMCEMYT
jgi:hypothetical protein